MAEPNHIMLTDAEKKSCISTLTPNLATLRIRAGISQEALAEWIGVSRQTYGTIERGKKKMSWNTFLSLILYFDYNPKTHALLRSVGAFPQAVISRFGGDTTGIPAEAGEVSAMLGENAPHIIRRLDEQALHSIRTIIMVEYARCTKTPGEFVVKSFDGVEFFDSSLLAREAEARSALQEIRKQNDASAK